MDFAYGVLCETVPGSGRMDLVGCPVSGLDTALEVYRKVKRNHKAAKIWKRVRLVRIDYTDMPVHDD